jgi:hypothetical protein
MADGAFRGESTGLALLGDVSFDDDDDDRGLTAFDLGGAARAFGAGRGFISHNHDGTVLPKVDFCTG